MTPSDQRAILGIDAAWTPNNPSGVALLASEGSSWICRALAPSYHSFVDLSCGTPVDWSVRKYPGDVPSVPKLLQACDRLLDDGTKVSVVPVDIPVATVPITGRRTADRRVSEAFGAKGCAVHSPSLRRPGQVGPALRDGFVDAGFQLATTETSPERRDASSKCIPTRLC